MNTLIINGLDSIAKMEAINIFGALVASLLHDFKHPGKTNGFLKTAKDDLAMVYNDKAILENMHVSEAFKVIRRAECNILQGMTREEYEQTRFLIVELVLATDMSEHFNHIRIFETEVLPHFSCEGGEDGSQSGAALDAMHLEIMKLALHAADTSNCAKDLAISCNWTDRLLDEFFAQGDVEKSQGLPVSALCDRDKVLKPDSQIGFITAIISPTWNLFLKMFPANSSLSKEVMGNIECNLAFWRKEKTKLAKVHKAAQDDADAAIAAVAAASAAAAVGDKAEQTAVAKSMLQASEGEI
jgi:hypothetical protein